MNDLTGALPDLALKITLTAGVPGATILSILLLSFAVFCLRRQKRAAGSFVYVAVPLILAGLGGGAWLNEHLLKPLLDIPRPSISYLASTPPEAPVLALSTDEYYALPGKQARRDHLHTVLQSEAGQQLPISESIRQHWAHQDGFGFPSGHTFAAAFISVFFLAVAIRFCSGWQRNFYYLLLPWCLCVAYSRLVLGVHSLTDVVGGGLMGLVLGSSTFWAANSILRRLNRD